MPSITPEFVQKMADVLELYARPLNAREPVVALDERPTMLRADARPAILAKPRHPKKRDYEYRRHGTANIFCIVEPKAGRHLTFATPNRDGRAFAFALRTISKRYRRATKIHLVMDNLSTHSAKCVVDALGSHAAERLLRRFEFHFTPKHASWLNIAEIEASLVSRECLGRDRVASFEALRSRVAAWQARIDGQRRKINWTFTIDDAANIFGVDRVNKLLTEH